LKNNNPQTSFAIIFLKSPLRCHQNVPKIENSHDGSHDSHDGDFQFLRHFDDTLMGILKNYQVEFKFGKKSRSRGPGGKK